MHWLDIRKGDRTIDSKDMFKSPGGTEKEKQTKKNQTENRKMQLQTQILTDPSLH